MNQKFQYWIFLLVGYFFVVATGCSQPNPTPLPPTAVATTQEITAVTPTPTTSQDIIAIETPTETAVSPSATPTPSPTDTPLPSPTNTPTTTPTSTRAIINSDNAAQLTTQQVLTTNGPLYDVVASPDKTLMVITSQTGVQIYETAVLTPLHEFPLPVSEATLIAWSPAGQALALVDDTGTLYVWEREHNQPIPLHQDNSGILTIARSPDGTMLAAGKADNTIQVWYESNWEMPVILAGHTEPVTQLAWSPDSTMLAARSRGDLLIWWDVSTGATIDRQLDVADLTWFADSSHIALVRGATVDVKTAVGETAYSLTGHNSSISHLSWSPTDPTLLATVGRDRQILVWDVNTQTVKHALIGHEGLINHLNWSPDGQQIISADDKWVWVWDAVTGNAQSRLPRHLGIRQAIWLSNETVLTVGSQDNLVRSWQSHNGQVVTTIGNYKESSLGVIAIAWAPDNLHLAELGDDSVVRIWDTGTNTVVQALFGHLLEFSPDGKNISFVVNDIAWSPDGTQIATASADHTIRIWDVATAQELNVLPHDQDVVVLAWSPDGKQITSIAAGDSPVSSQLHLWNVQSGQKIWDRTIPVKTPTDLLWSPDSTKIAIGIDEGNSSIQIRDAANGETLTRLQWAGEIGVWDVDWSPDGTRLASASQEGDIHLWDTTFFDLTTGQLLTTLAEAHQPGALGVVWFHDNDGLASLGSEGDLRLWSVPAESLSGTVAFTQEGFFVQPVEDPREIPIRLTAGKRIYLAISPDGTQLAVVTADHTIQLLRIP